MMIDLRVIDIADKEYEVERLHLDWHRHRLLSRHQGDSDILSPYSAAQYSIWYSTKISKKYFLFIFNRIEDHFKLPRLHQIII